MEPVSNPYVVYVLAPSGTGIVYVILILLKRFNFSNTPVGANKARRKGAAFEKLDGKLSEGAIGQTRR